MAHLFDPLTIRDIAFANRVFVSPMCEYSSVNGLANDWHFVHLGSRAVGGAGLVLTEATAVLPKARISPQDLGIWSHEHIEPLARIVRFIHERGSVAGMQLAHAGRNASTYRPWEGHGAIPESAGGWKNVVAPSALPFAEHYPMPHELSRDGIKEIVAAFAEAARRACEAGFRVLEIHTAHGYLIHEFLSPLSNVRTEDYGGSFESRTRILREVVAAVRFILARAGSAVRAHFRKRLERWRLGHSAVGRVGAAVERAGSRSHRLLLRRQRFRRENPRWAGPIKRRLPNKFAGKPAS